MIDTGHLGSAPDDNEKDFDAALIRSHSLTLATETLREAQVDLAQVDRITTIGRLSATHEVTQPITAIVTNAQAARHFLDRRPPDLDEVRQALDCIVRDAYRASDVIYRIRGFLKEAPPKRERGEINGVIRDVLELTRGEAAKNGVSVQTQFAEPSPVVRADRVGLQQVILNLIINAVEAMSGMREGARELLICTEKAESNVAPGGGTRFGAGSGSEECGAPIRGLLYNQDPGHGHRLGHLPFDHRGAWRADMGRRE
jgi:C4-dicarboxylate-specific signal transduction histidine kinase